MRGHSPARPGPGQPASVLFQNLPCFFQTRSSAIPHFSNTQAGITASISSIFARSCHGPGYSVTLNLKGPGFGRPGSAGPVQVPEFQTTHCKFCHLLGPCSPQPGPSRPGNGRDNMQSTVPTQPTGLGSRGRGTPARPLRSIPGRGSSGGCTQPTSRCTVMQHTVHTQQKLTGRIILLVLSTSASSLA
jgi:hypothetical protein